MFQLHGLQLVDLIKDLETGAPDAYLHSSTETSFIGVQATRASIYPDGMCTIAKTKQ